MALGEVFPALQSGALDAAELATPWFDMGYGLFKAAKYYYSPGFHEPGHTLELMFNKKVWDSLSPADQETIRLAAQAQILQSEAEVIANDPAALDQLTGKFGVALKAFPDDILRAMQKAASEIIPAAVADDPMARKIYESYAGFQKSVLKRELPTGGRRARAVALGGVAVAGYHTALVAGWAPKWWIPCGAGPSCSDQKLVILGDIQIPWLSLLAFTVIVALLLVYLKKTRP